MKKFILKGLLYILPILLCAYPLDYLISKYLSESNYYAGGETKDWNDIYKGNINSDLVIYGSSRAYRHFSPKIIEDSLNISTYNLGINGNNFWLQYFRHKELLKYNKKPKYIIMSIDPFSLQKAVGMPNSIQFLPYLLWNKNLKEYISYRSGYSFIDYNIPLARYFGEKTALFAALSSFFNFRNNPVRYKGYKGRESEWNGDFDKAKDQLDNYDIDIDPEYVKLFEQFINECNREGIKLIFVYTPLYIDGQLFIKNREEVTYTFQHFSDKYKIPFIDYSNDELSFQKQYFYNTTHLNKRGSEIFTKKLIKELIL